MLIQQGKTNWLYILIVFMVAVIVGAAAWYFQEKIEVQEPLLLPSVSPSPSVNPEEHSGEIDTVRAFLPQQYSLEDEIFVNEDITGDGQDEIVFMARAKETEEKPYGTIFWRVYFGVIARNEGNPRQVLSSEILQKEYPLELECWSRWAAINGFFDLNDDGKKEIVDLGLTCPGANAIVHGLFSINWDLGKIETIRLLDESGEVNDGYLVDGGGAGGGSSFSFQDKNKEGIKELILTSYAPGNDDWVFLEDVYILQNGTFVYSKELSD